MQENRKHTTSEMRTSDGAYVKIESHASLLSTAALAKEYAAKGYPDKYVVFTDRQRPGRLTATKAQEGDLESGVFMSVILRPSFFPSQAGLLKPLTAVAMLEGLKEYTPHNLQIGWVSDIFCDGKRIGGATVEGKLDSFSSYEYIIVTMAIKTDERSFPPRLSDMIKKVFDKEDTSIPLLIAKNVLNKFLAVYTSLKSPEKYVDIYKKSFILSGKVIKYVDESGKHRCRVLGADNDCMLIIEDKNKEIKHISNAKSVIIPSRIKVKK